MRVMRSVTDVGKYRDFPSSCNRAGAKMRSGNEIHVHFSEIWRLALLNLDNQCLSVA